MRVPVIAVLASLLATVATAPAVPARDGLEPAAGRLLVASRQLTDPNFDRSVVLLLSYDPGGAVGLIVNRPSEVKLSHALPDLDGRLRSEQPVWVGGPVSPTAMRMLFRSAERFDESERVVEDVQVSGSRELLQSIVGKKGRRAIPFKVFAGYAGWAPGQLDHEIARGDWHVVEGEAGLVFAAEPFKIWQRLAPVAPGLRAEAR